MSHIKWKDEAHKQQIRRIRNKMTNQFVFESKNMKHNKMKKSFLEFIFWVEKVINISMIKI